MIFLGIDLIMLVAAGLIVQFVMYKIRNRKGKDDK